MKKCTGSRQPPKVERRGRAQLTHVCAVCGRRWNRSTRTAPTFPLPDHMDKRKPPSLRFFKIIHHDLPPGMPPSVMQWPFTTEEELRRTTEAFATLKDRTFVEIDEGEYERLRKQAGKFARKLRVIARKMKKDM